MTSNHAINDLDPMLYKRDMSDDNDGVFISILSKAFSKALLLIEIFELCLSITLSELVISLDSYKMPLRILV